MINSMGERAGNNMNFKQGLQQELQNENINIQAVETELVLTSTDIVKLNHEIGLMIEADKIMLESSPGKAARFACSK
ncbi:MAG: hypothetical protein NC249_12160 [Lachnoclostridium sp.]|nr:hypothetical protein [Lachnoclostridium sp.]